MQIFYIRDIEKFEFQHETACIIGNFDGIHKGHVNLISNLIKNAKKYNLKSSCVVFYPHTKILIFDKVQNLTTFKEQIEILKNLGIENLFILKFDKKIQNLQPIEFLEKSTKSLNIKCFTVSQDFKFGKNASGSVDIINNFCIKNDIYFDKIKEFLYNNEVCSASKIRYYILNGKINIANEMLGFLYFIHGKVVKGLQNGRKIGFPTVNILYKKIKIIPQNGVYQVKVSIDRFIYNGICNIGVRPTILSNGIKVVEVHILNFNEIIYGEFIKIEFIKKIRNEIKFASLEDLKNQIEIDINYIKN